MPAYADHILSAHEGQTTPDTSKQFAAQTRREDVVISGMSGRFPESSSIKEFEKNLYEGVDMITENDMRWTPGIYGLPKRHGKIPRIHEFDASFFNVAPKQAHCMDPQLRMLLEVTCEAIFDAGIHPNALRGKPIGVYVGTSGSETDNILTENPDNISGYEMTGCCRAMFANRLSFAMDFKGPSYAVDTACSSSMVALNAAWKAIEEGEIEGAIVAGSQLNLKPQTSLQFNRLSMLAEDGRCKAFDISGNGYVRSEAVAAIFLQRSRDAKRIYAHVINASTNTDGFKGDGITFPSGAIQKQLLLEVYEKAGVDPNNVTYVEAHGTGTKVGDPQEVNAIDEVFCKNRTEPLLIGSVKSNMGHAEPASGVCSIIKVLLAIKNQEIPANLHFNEPNPNIPALSENRLKVVTKNTPWRGQYVGINSFGFGGSNVHVLLRAPSNVIHTQDRMFDSIGSLRKGHPRLVVYSGRTEENVTKVLKEFQTNQDPNFASLIDNIAEAEASHVSYPYRGYTVVGGNSDLNVLEVTDAPAEQHPLWLVFSGMGSQWTGCGIRLMELPTFATVIHKCRSALLPFGIDVLDIITRTDPDPMASTTASFTAIAAIQVGLVEVLKSLGLNKFDGYIGHSVGELGCGYADGCLTAEQTVFAAYWRGRSVEEAGLPLGKMAAVGLSAEEAEVWCHNQGSTVMVACHNSSNSVTISGPRDDVDHLMEKFEAEGIFCRAVNSGNIAFHHPSLRKAAPRLLAELQKVILAPVTRSSKWVSTSFPEYKWDTGLARQASPEYLVNNLVSPVLFAEGLLKIPSNSRVIEVAPHALMQAILRRALPQCLMMPLVRKEAKDVLSHLLQGIGKLYASGENVHISTLSSSIMPVPSTTPTISNLIEWDHSVEWTVADYTSIVTSKEFKVEINLNENEYSFLEGHAIDGRVLFPATGYMVLAWKALAKLVDTEWENLPVTFTDVSLHEATVLSANNKGVTFMVRILPKKGEFEVIAGETVAASGKIQVGVKESAERTALQNILCKANVYESEDSSNMGLTHSEVYKELKIRGYHYDGVFKGIKEANLKGTKGKLMWKSNWIPLLDTMLQFSLLGSPNKGLYLPTRIRKVLIEPSKFNEEIINKDDEAEASVEVNHNYNIGVTMCPGIEIHGLKATMAPRRAISDEPLLEKYIFVPNHISTKLEISDNELVRTIMDLIIENIPTLKLKIGHQNLKGPEETRSINVVDLAVYISKVFELYPLMAMEYSMSIADKSVVGEKLVSIQDAGIEVVDELNHSVIPKLNLLIITNSENKLEDFSLVSHLGPSSFIMVDCEDMKDNLVNIGFVEAASVEKLNLHLLRKPRAVDHHELFIVSEADTEFSWVEDLKEKLMSEDTSPLWLVSKGEPSTGLLGMFKCLKREPSGQRTRCIIDSSDSVEIGSKLWKRIIETDLSVNIIQKKTLGTMRHFLLPELTSSPAEHSYLNVLTRGDLSSLTWLAAPLPPKEKYRETMLSYVNYAPLNFRDIMLASGKLPPDALPGDLAQKECILGLEFAGVSERGIRVMGLVAAGGLATTVRSDPLLTWNVPDNWSLREAATVPVVYATAYYALVVRGNIRKGESVLIHAGSGGVGQAAISIALSRECIVYTTVSSDKKREFLKERFPQLRDDNFANSRDSTFEYHILEQTKGKGVDMVLNSLAGDLLQASVRCLKEHGRFLEIGKADLASNTALGMSIFLKNITFHGILLDALFDGTSEKKTALQELLYDGLKSGEVQPLHVTSFSFDKTEDAFRFMASGKHIGKVVLEIKDEDADAANKVIVKSKRKAKLSEIKEVDDSEFPGIPSVYRLWPSQDFVYVITGGLGGLGLEIADWLIGRGAQKLVLTSRRGVATGYQALCIQRWLKAGVNVRVLQQDASTYEGAEALLKDAAQQGPIGGIFHLAVILEDSIIENQSSLTYKRVNKVKANGARHLDASSRKLCPDLHLWVTFSSVACGRGNAGQSNYGWANSVSEKIVEKRVADGLPGCAIQWGGIGDVGVLADTLGNIEVGGTKPQSVRSVLGCLDQLIGSEQPVVASLCLSSSKASSGRDTKGGKSLVSAIANILGIKDMSKAPMNVTLGDFGADSLMAVEIKQTLEREADLVLDAEQIKELTFARLTEIESSEGQSATTDSNGPVNQFAWLDFPLISKDIIKHLHTITSTEHSPIPLFFASPIQGTCDVLTEIASKINYNVIGLEYPDFIPTNNISHMVETLIQKMEEIYPEGPYHLAGYSFGASVAYELANQMEKKGRKPQSLILLDGSHSYVSGIIDSYRDKFKFSNTTNSNESSTEKDKQVQVQGEVEAMLLYTYQFCSTDAKKLRESLLYLPTWDDRLSFVAKTILEETKATNRKSILTIEEIKGAASMFYDRLFGSFYHDSFNSIVSSPTMLIRASQNAHMATFGADYGLLTVLKGKLTIKEVTGTHETFIMGKSAAEVSNYINEFIVSCQ